MHNHGIDDAAWASPWRRRAVIDKVVLCVGLVLVALFSPAWPGSILVIVTAVALMYGPGGLSPKAIVIAALAPAVFLLLGGIPIAIHIGSGTIGTEIASLGPIHLTQEGLIRALAVSAHGVAGTMALMVLAVTTPMVDLVASMRRIGIPAPAVDIAMLMYQMIFGLIGTIETITEAQASRLGHTTFKRKANSAAALMGTMLVRTFDQAMRTADGLAGRGYTNDLKTLGVELNHSNRFVVLSILYLLVLGGISMLFVSYGWAVGR